MDESQQFTDELSSLRKSARDPSSFGSSFAQALETVDQGFKPFFASHKLPSPGHTNSAKSGVADQGLVMSGNGIQQFANAVNGLRDFDEHHHRLAALQQEIHLEAAKYKHQA